MLLVIWVLFIFTTIIWVLNRRNIFIFFASIPFLYGVLLKPLVIILGGNFLLYQDMYSVSYYTIGYLFELCWFNIIYLTAFLSNRSARQISFTHKNHYIKYAKQNTWSYRYWLLSLVVVVIAMYSLIGNQIFVENRTSSFSSIHPFMRYLFPFVLFGQITALALLFGMVVEKRIKPKILVIIASVLFAFFITNQRGILVTGILLSLGFLVVTNRIATLKAFLICGVTGILAIYLKLINSLIHGNMSEALGDLSLFLQGPDGVSLQVWSILLSYVEGNGHSNGVTLLNGILGLFPHTLRVALNFMTVTDVLNVYYDPVGYLENGFGFNGTLAHDAYLSFGWFGLCLGAPVGFYLGKFCSGIPKLLGRKQYLLLFTNGFLVMTILGSGLQVIHWFLIPYGFIILGKFARFR